MSQVPNPLPWLTGKDFSKWLKHNDYPVLPPHKAPPIVIASARPRKGRKPFGAESYKGTG